MFDTDTFLTTLYVMCDDLCKTHEKAHNQTQLSSNTPTRMGRPVSLTRSEVLTLSLFGAWGRFASERDFWRWAQRNGKAAFPTLPDRSTFHRLRRAAWPELLRLFEALSEQALSQEKDEMLYQVMDTTALVTRNFKRRGRSWLEGIANLGYCSREGWFCGLRVLLCVSPRGAITGFGLSHGSCKDQPLADAFLAARAHQDPHDEERPPVGSPSPVLYLADSGFGGKKNHKRWREEYGAPVCAVPQRVKKSDPHPWPRAMRRQHAAWRQIIETVNAKLLHTFGMDTERPHSLEGAHVRLLARCALHNFCLLLNRQQGRPDLQFADLWKW
jgi:hypothetical protein